MVKHSKEDCRHFVTKTRRSRDEHALEPRISGTRNAQSGFPEGTNTGTEHVEAAGRIRLLLRVIPPR
jgi:hypothetical protein